MHIMHAACCNKQAKTRACSDVTACGDTLQFPAHGAGHVTCNHITEVIPPLHMPGGEAGESGEAPQMALGEPTRRTRHSFGIQGVGTYNWVILRKKIGNPWGFPDIDRNHRFRWLPSPPTGLAPPGWAGGM